MPHSYKNVSSISHGYLACQPHPTLWPNHDLVKADCTSEAKEHKHSGSTTKPNKHGLLSLEWQELQQLALAFISVQKITTPTNNKSKKDAQKRNTPTSEPQRIANHQVLLLTTRNPYTLYTSTNFLLDKSSYNMLYTNSHSKPTQNVETQLYNSKAHNACIKHSCIPYTHYHIPCLHLIGLQTLYWPSLPPASTQHDGSVRNLKNYFGK